MAGTITITVSGGRSRTSGVIFALVNSVVSGTVGYALSQSGRVIPGTVAAIAAVALCATYLTLIIWTGRIPFPKWPGQLPDRWLDRRRPGLTAARYGIVWGLVFSTPIRAGSLAVLAVIVVHIASPVSGFALFAIVGALRAAPTTARAFESAAKPRDVPNRRLAWHRPLISAFDGILLAIVLMAMIRTTLD
jgi:hypothetical protein